MQPRATLASTHRALTPRTPLQFATDAFHGFGYKFATGSGARYPKWFPTLVGLWQLAIAFFALHNGGERQLAAQAMLATLMGGAVHHHVVGEGQAAHAGGGILFLALSVFAAVISGTPLPLAVGAGAGFAALGFGMGTVVAALTEPEAGKAKGGL